MAIKSGLDGNSNLDPAQENTDEYSDVRRLPRVAPKEDLTVETHGRVAQVIPFRSPLADLPLIADKNGPFTEAQIVDLRDEDILINETLDLLDDLGITFLVVENGQFSFARAKEVAKMVFDSVVAANDVALLTDEMQMYVKATKERFANGGPAYLEYLKKLKQLDYLLRAWAS